jgi:hypothetical protein
MLCYKQWIDLTTLSQAFYFIFSGSAAQHGLWPPVALQPSVGYGLLIHEVS